MSELKQRISDDVKTAMRAKDKQRLTTIRMIMAAIKQREVDERIDLDNSQVIAVLEKMIKQRRDAAGQYESAGRQELADKEQAEIAIIQAYLPMPLSASELDELISAAITQSGAESMRDMGKVMGILKPQIQGRADMGAVSQQIKQRLN